MTNQAPNAQLNKNNNSEPENLSYSFVRHRRSFAKVKPIIGMPNLIDIQKKSYSEFLQGHVSAEFRLDAGLQGVFKSVFPVQDFDSTASVEFVSYSLDDPKYNGQECRSKGIICCTR